MKKKIKMASTKLLIENLECKLDKLKTFTIGPKTIKNEPNYIELEKHIYLSKSVNSDF